MNYMSLLAFVRKKCENKSHWCNGKHIPGHRKKMRGNITGDTSNGIDKEPCWYYKDNRCMHPENPKNW